MKKAEMFAFRPRGSFYDPFARWDSTHLSTFVGFSGEVSEQTSIQGRLKATKRQRWCEMCSRWSFVNKSSKRRRDGEAF